MIEYMIIEKPTLEGICDAVREQEGSTELIPTLELADRVRAIGSSAENKFTQLVDGSLTEITAKDLEGVMEIRKYMFANCSALTKVALPNDITRIGEYAFYDCKSLTNITLPSSITSIEIYTFAGCTSLTAIVIPDKVTKIGNSAFNACNALADVTIGNSVTSIGQYALACPRLTSLTIPDSVKSIENFAFYHNSALSVNGTFTFLGTVPPTIKTLIFNEIYLEKIIVPKGCCEAYKSATNWAKFADFIEEAAE